MGAQGVRDLFYLFILSSPSSQENIDSNGVSKSMDEFEKFHMKHFRCFLLVWCL